MKYVLYSNINSNISLPLSYALYWSSFLLSSLQHEKRCVQEGGRRRTFWKPSLNDSLNPVNLIIINLVLRIDSIQFANCATRLFSFFRSVAYYATGLLLAFFLLNLWTGCCCYQVRSSTDGYNVNCSFRYLQNFSFS